MVVWLVRVSVYNIVINAKGDNELRVTVLKKKLSKLIKGRLQQQRRWANPVVAIREGADEIYFVFAWSEWIHLVYRPVNVFFWYMEVMKVVVSCLSFYGFQTIVYFRHSSITANTLFLLLKFLVVTKADLFAIYLFVAQLFSCFDQNYFN